MTVSLFGCKGKEEEPAKALTPEPTPTPVVTLDDLIEVQKENTAKYMNLIKTAVSDQDLEMPDVSATAGIETKGSIDLMSIYTADFSINGTFDIRSFANIAHILADVSADLDLTTNGSTTKNSNQNKLEVYLDNTGDNDKLKIYTKDGDKDWTVTEKLISELIQNVENNENTENDQAEGKEYFKDIDVFLKNHSTMESEFGVFRNTTAFTMQEFREYYQADFNSIENDISEMIGSSAALFGMIGAEGGEQYASSVINTIVGMFREWVSGMTGDVKMVQEFDSELKPTKMTMTISNFSVSSTGNNFNTKFAFDELSINIVNRDDKEPVVIPDNVKNTAVSDDLNY